MGKNATLRWIAVAICRGIPHVLTTTGMIYTREERNFEGLQEYLVEGNMISSGRLPFLAGGAPCLLFAQNGWGRQGYYTKDWRVSISAGDG